MWGCHFNSINRNPKNRLFTNLFSYIYIKSQVIYSLGLKLGFCLEAYTMLFVFQGRRQTGGGGGERETGKQTERQLVTWYVESSPDRQTETDREADS